MKCKYAETCGHEYCNLDDCPEYEAAPINRKICPLKLIAGNNSYAQSPFCEKELCAWYAKYANDCCIPTLVGEFADSVLSRTSYDSLKGGF